MMNHEMFQLSDDEDYIPGNGGGGAASEHSYHHNTQNNYFTSPSHHHHHNQYSQFYQQQQQQQPPHSPTSFHPPQVFTNNNNTMSSFSPTATLSPQQFRIQSLFHEMEREYVGLLQENEMLKQRLEEYERVLFGGVDIPPHQLAALRNDRKRITANSTHSQSVHNSHSNHNNATGNNSNSNNNNKPLQSSSNMDKLSKKFANPYQKVKSLIAQTKTSFPIPMHEVTHNWTNRSIVQRFYYHLDVINNVTCIPSYGNSAAKQKPFIASCSMDSTVCIFATDRRNDITSRIVQRPEFVYRGHKSAVNTICFHPTTPLACSASGDGTVHLWKWAFDGSTVVGGPSTSTTIGQQQQQQQQQLQNVSAANNNNNNNSKQQKDHVESVRKMSNVDELPRPVLRREDSDLGIDLSTSHSPPVSARGDYHSENKQNTRSEFHTPTLDIPSSHMDDHRDHNNDDVDEEYDDDTIATQDLLSTSEFMSIMSQEHEGVPTKSTPLLSLDHDGNIVIAAQYHQSRSNTEHSVVSASWDRCIRQWDINTGKLITKTMHHEAVCSSSSSSDNVFIPNFEGHKFDVQITDLQSANHNPWVVTACNNGLCKIWDSVSNQFTHQFQHTKEQSINMETCAVFNPNDRMIITATQDGSCKIWDMRKLSDKACLKSFSVHSGVNRLAVSSYHSRFCVATNKRQIKVYDLSGKCLDTLQKQGHEMMVTGVCWSENGEEVFSCSADRSILHWKLGADEMN